MFASESMNACMCLCKENINLHFTALESMPITCILINSDQPTANDYICAHNTLSATLTGKAKGQGRVKMITTIEKHAPASR